MKWYSLFGERNVTISISSPSTWQFSFLRIYPKAIESPVHTGTRGHIIGMFAAALFIVAENWTPSECPSTADRLAAMEHPQHRRPCRHLREWIGAMKSDSWGSYPVPVHEKATQCHVICYAHIFM